MSANGVFDRILVTGAAGFVGRHLQDALRDRGYGKNLIAFDRRDEAGPTRQVDVRDADSVRSLIRREQPTAIFHLAAISAVTAATSDVRQAWDVNLGGTLNVVEAIRSDAPAAKLLFVSSAEIYGRSLNSADAVSESALLQPVNPYAASKAAADILVRQAAAQGVQSIVARPFNHTGPGQAELFVVPSFASQIARIELGQQPPELRVGSLDDYRDFLDVQDVVSAYIRMMERIGSLNSGRPFNIASGQALRIGDILERLLSRASIRISVKVDESRLRQAPISRVVGDASAARQVFDWHPVRSFNDCLDSVLDDCRRRVRMT